MSKPKTPAIDLFDEGEAEIRAQLALIAERRGDKTIGFDRDMALSTAALARAMVALENERRQRNRAELRAIGSFPLEQLVAFVKSLPPDKRDAFCTDVLNSDADEPLL